MRPRPTNAYRTPRPHSLGVRLFCATGFSILQNVLIYRLYPFEDRSVQPIT